MKIASISDIHGNIESLQAVVRDIKREGIEKIFVCGDLAVAGPNPSETLDLLQELSKTKEVIFILGNTDEMILKANNKEGSGYYPDGFAMKAAVKYCQKVLRNDQLEFLRSLPEKQSLRLGELNILIVHGSPRHIAENIYPDMESKEVARIIEGYNEDIIFCGHTHLPAIYKVGYQTVVNNGSIGRPFTDVPDACYAILDYPDLNSKSFRIYHKYVEYENWSTADKLKKIVFEGSERLARIILTPMERHNPANS